MFDISKFTVHLSIERVTRIPYSAGNIYVRWNVLESPRPDAHGRTPARQIKDTEASLKYEASFRQRISQHYPSKLLRSCSIKFEVVWEPVGGRGVTIGTLTLDLSQFASDYKKQHDMKKENGEASAKYLDDNDKNCVDPSSGVSGRSLLYLLEEARNNSLLELSISLEHTSGNTDYKPNEFNGPAVNYNNRHTTIEEESELCTGPGVSHRNRENLRKLKKAVFQDLSNEDHLHSSNHAERDWLDIDKFLQGHKIEVCSEDLDAELQKHNIRNVSDASTEHQGRKTPFLETDIREHFINWSVMPI